MDIYENLIKQSRIVVFIIDDEEIVVDTNLFTMRMLNSYDISGRSLYSFLDDISQLNMKSYLALSDSNGVELNLLASDGEVKQITATCSKVNGYIAILGVPKMSRVNTLSTDAVVQEDRRQWQIKNIDPETGLYSKEFFRHIFGLLYTKAVNMNSNVGVICFEVDDTDDRDKGCSHDKSSRILKGLGHLILTKTRSTDYVVKYGEKVVLLVPFTNMEVLKKISQRIKSEAYNSLNISLRAEWACTVDDNIGDDKEALKFVYEKINSSKNNILKDILDS